MSHAVSTPPDLNLATARRQLQRVALRYAARRAATILLPALAAGVLLGILAAKWPAARPALAVVAAVVVLLAAWRLWPLRRLQAATIAPRLDRHFAELEDSAGLLLQDPDRLNLLGTLQQQRVGRRLQELQDARTLSLPVSYRRAAWASGLLLLGSALAWWWPVSAEALAPAGVAINYSASGSVAAGQKPAQIVKTELLVTPPAYTRQPAFGPGQASFQCPAGSRVRWQVRVQHAGRLVPQLELGAQRQAMRPVPGQPGVFAADQVLTASVLYRLRLGNTVSDDYAIEVRADQAPVLRIQTPKTYTLVEFGMPSTLPVRATVRDDYGLSRTEMVITVAQGEGEAVKFREVRRDLTSALRGGQPTETSLLSQLNLPQLGLTYGDELYFYLSARDNAGHSSRTDAYLVQWQDTAVQDSPTDLGMGVKVAPAYFRSQRQIIIDTEKLLAEKPRLDAATLSSRANDLGFDQQTLRLRYGKFMGEESGASIGAAPRAPIAEEEEAASPTAEAHEKEEEHSADDGHDHATPPPGKESPTAITDALMEPYVHKHDDSETADFLEPAVKAKLRAVLDQMWAAELRLRAGQLSAALPYEYRALRLLKQVQQQTRAYVKKAGFVLPPMPEATTRLSGELAGASVPQRQRTVAAPVSQPTVRAALRWLATTPPGSLGKPADARLLEPAGAALAGAALQRPGLYLPALRALRSLVNDVRAGRAVCADCRRPIERGLTELLAAPTPTPVPPPAPDRLARRYFQELSR